ncbi:Crp/Fnr family transcriptional regulator [Hufsiella ginkgonis]|uniref:Cyclic nucleotide-binding domain-containing protein n=1 Tax=Hufsiella ginkgonis TaxID=2695274 RepID=A0A7K1XXI5_9SPHI|nr:Crp/Fnr family transcriptional regulator [Hufsiella ginkgonis]MXV15725.1 cyclic nucleotide-binding domain-containing protein [Hufsiella ginkgonis]
MFREIDKHITRCAPVSGYELEILHGRLKSKTVKKKTLLLRQGEVCRFEAYIIKGCVKKYYIDQQGDQVILQFAVEDWWISDIGSFSEQKPSNLFIETLEDTELLVIDFENKEILFREVPRLERVFRIMVQRSYSVLESRFYAAITHTAESRYLDFVKRYPQIVQRVPQQQIASYLGITPESLSRIKKQLMARK